MKTKGNTFCLIVFTLIFSLMFSILPKTQAQVSGENQPDTIFSNTAPITINTASTITAPTTASLYPSNISVSGMTGNTTRVQVSLRGLSHTRPQDLDFLLVGPGGQKFIFLSDAGATAPQDGVYTFADDAPTTLQSFSAFPPGFYKPANFGTGDTFPAPAPAAPYDSPAPAGTATFASVFNGASPNGTWSLYAVDDSLNFIGAIYSGWELTVTSNGSPQTTFANSSYVGLEEANTRANPYPSVINVSGQTGVVSSVKVTLNNFSHALTPDVDVLLVNPNGSSVVLMSDAGNGAASNINLTFDDAAPGVLSASQLVFGTFKPTDYADSGGNDFFPPPAPQTPYFTLQTGNGLSAFNNFSPNGDWQLYVVDDAGNALAGTIAGGWSLDITTVPSTSPQVGCAFPSLVPSQSAVGSTPTNLAVGDFNNDGKPDLAVTNQVSNDVSILINNGSGGFLTQTTVMAGTNPYAVAVGLFNNDNNLDLAVINSGSNNVSILLGNGNGTFSVPTNFTAGASPISIAVGDFNNDNKRDLAIANFGGFFSGTVSILLGNGNGGFALPLTVRTGTQPAFVKVANINGDANQDLIVANFGGNSVQVFYGTGTGAFALNQTLTSSGGPVSIEFADVSNDGFPDILVANYNGGVGLFGGSASGTFSAYSSISGNVGNPISVTVTDILNDGTNHVAFAYSGGNQVSVATNGSLFNFQNYVVGLNPNAIVKADFNGDGKIDLATANSGSDSVTILTNSCTVAKGNIFDFTGDRRTDIGIFRPSNGSWNVLNLSSPFYFGRDRDVIVPADYNGDLQTDFAVFRPENGTWIIPKTSGINPLGTFYYLQFGLGTDIPAPADYDGDGKADIAVFRPSNGFWYIRRSTDNATQSVMFGANGDRPVAADYDGDGKADIAVFRPSNGAWYILGSTSGFFGVTFGMANDRAVPADYDGDGKTDVAVFRDGTWYVLKSSNGGFLAVNFGTTGDIPVPGDYEGDGKIDFAVYRPSQGAWYIQRSSDGGFQGAAYGLPTDVPIPSAFVR